MLNELPRPSKTIREDIQAGRLQAVLTDFQVHPQANMDMGIYALYLPNRRHSVRVTKEKAFQP